MFSFESDCITSHHRSHCVRAYNALRHWQRHPANAAPAHADTPCHRMCDALTKWRIPTSVIMKHYECAKCAPARALLRTHGASACTMYHAVDFLAWSDTITPCCSKQKHFIRSAAMWFKARQHIYNVCIITIMHFGFYTGVRSNSQHVPTYFARRLLHARH